MGQGHSEDPPPGVSQTQGQSLPGTSQGGKQKSPVGELEALGDSEPSLENLLIQERSINVQLNARLQVALGDLEASNRSQAQKKATKSREASPVQAPPNSGEEEGSRLDLSTPTRTKERLDMPPPNTIPPRRPRTKLERCQHQFKREISELEGQLVDFKRNGVASQRLEMAVQDWSELKKRQEEVDEAYIAQMEKEASEDEISRLDEEGLTFYGESKDRVWGIRTELRGCQLQDGLTSKEEEGDGASWLS